MYAEFPCLLKKKNIYIYVAFTLGWLVCKNDKQFLDQVPKPNFNYFLEVFYNRQCVHLKIFIDKKTMVYL